MKILFCASEVAPFAKTGGLADVTGTLPKALGGLGVQVKIMMPRYRGLGLSRKKLFPGVDIHFLENEFYFNRSSLYGNGREDYPDNLKRFAFFCEEALSLCKRLSFKPDLVHVHDWQTALLPVLLKTKFSADPFFKGVKSLLTIHNLAYQGLFPRRNFEELGLEEKWNSIDGFEFYGKVNLLKAGILFADALNTVSPRYAEEILTKEYGYGLEGVLQKREDSLEGILNGIDEKLWDPKKDKTLPKKFSAESVSGKGVCKEALQSELGLEANAGTPLFAMVTRLAQQKGLDLLLESASHLLSKKLQFVLLGEGDHTYESSFKNLAARYPKNAAIRIGFNARLAHQIYAGADFFLMPSIFEPCGLGQLISLRYGTLPVVRRTGGLADTVTDLDEDPKRGNGFSFEKLRSGDLLGTVDRALILFQNKKKLEGFQKKAMRLHFSWKESAEHYKELYCRTVKAESGKRKAESGKWGA